MPACSSAASSVNDLRRTYNIILDFKHSLYPRASPPLSLPDTSHISPHLFLLRTNRSLKQASKQAINYPIFLSSANFSTTVLIIKLRSNS